MHKFLSWDYLGWKKFYKNYHQADWNESIAGVISIAKIEYYEMIQSTHHSSLHSHIPLTPNQIRVSKNLNLLISGLSGYDARRKKYSGLDVVFQAGLSDERVLIENSQNVGPFISIDIKNFHPGDHYHGDPHPHGHGHHDHEYDHHEYEHHHHGHHEHDHNDHHGHHPDPHHHDDHHSHDHNDHHDPKKHNFNVEENKKDDKHDDKKSPFDFIKKIFKK